MEVFHASNFYEGFNDDRVQKTVDALNKRLRTYLERDGVKSQTPGVYIMAVRNYNLLPDQSKDVCELFMKRGGWTNVKQNGEVGDDMLYEFTI